MSEVMPLTNTERRDNVFFLYEKWYQEGKPRPFAAIPPIVEGQKPLQQIFYFGLCYQALAQQPAPEIIIVSDWQRYLGSHHIEQVWDEEFDLRDFAVDPPVSRADSKGKIIDFVRIREYQQTWERLLPEPQDPEVTVDVLYASAGLKTGSFALVREMLLAERWKSEWLYRHSHVPSGRARKRTVRMGLVDLPEKADTFADFKAFSRASHAVFHLGLLPEDTFNDPITMGKFRCEVCDAARMAACPIPHCRWRRNHIENS